MNLGCLAGSLVEHVTFTLRTVSSSPVLGMEPTLKNNNKKTKTKVLPREYTLYKFLS